MNQALLLKTRYWVHDKSRLCRATFNADVSQEIKDGFREVTGEEQEEFRALTRKAKENGWKPGSRKPFESFLPDEAKSPKQALEA